MDVVSMWPMWLAGVGTLGLAAALWVVRQRAASQRARASRAARRRSEKAGRDDDRSDASARREQRDAGKGRRLGLSRGRGERTPDQLDTLIDWAPVATRVLTAHEREAWHVLRRALPDHMVLGQVPVARFIKVPTRNPYSEWLRRVGSLCADLVVCDAQSQVIAVVEVRQPASKENERARRRHARMDRVLDGARIPVHIWLEGALPGPVVAREAILGAATASTGPQSQSGNDTARRDAEAAAVVASLQGGGNFEGLSLQERAIDVVIDEAMDEWEASGGADGERKEPPPSTWFDDMDLDSGRMPLDGAQGTRVAEKA
ncbi:DUF2726 domain-containing protein [Aquabacterium sp. UBA2148]|uniref:DUF2726 domain-containing protein n=1 Tax=Aquabacterium sp. UBA2148 TaxID=1946042 RepID=UPI00257DCD44|nr:DUF2726 domain-containing protein [Aquabacterium sp. UBA2148]